MTGPEISYAQAGVDIDAGERAVELMRSAVARTRRPEVVGGLGGFAGLFAFEPGRWRRPLLAASTDGVGTKIAIAQAVGRHDTVGRDLVAMVADDLVVCGAEPLFLQDYIACGRVVPERIAEIVRGVADGCSLAGCALVLVLEGVMPLVAPRAWRDTFRKVTELSDGQLRFIGLASVAIGAIGLAMLYA